MEKINKSFLEKIIIKAIISDSEFLSRVSDNIDNIFSSAAYNEISLFYKNFYNKFNKLPTLEELKLYSSNNEFLNSLKTVYNDTQNIDLAKIDKNILYLNAESFVKEKLAINTLNNIIDKFQSGSIDPAELVNKFEKIAGISFLFDSGYNIYNDVNRYIESLKDDTNRIPTGFSEIDKNINGGIPAKGKCIAIVTAPTNMGKSIMLANIAVNAAKQGKNVLIISLEMSEEVYASRIYTDLYDLPINALPLMGAELKERINNNRYGEILIKEFPTGALTVSQLDSYIDSLYKAGHKFDLVCVDYLTLLNAPGAENSNEAGRQITRKLRALTYKYEIPFWTACQINRDGMKEGTPELQHIAESIAIAADADLIVSLHQQPEDKEMNIMRLSFLKSRLGNKGFTINLYFNHENLRFESMEGTTTSEMPQSERSAMIAIENALNFDEILENAS